MYQFAEKKKDNRKKEDSVQRKAPPGENRTGIPAQLKERIEDSMGIPLDDVRVHYNSDLPAKLDALAYTKGSQVEVAPGQERHLAHELGHVVQQKLGAVRANAWHQSGVAMNTDAALERQADEIGAGKRVAIVQRMADNVVQREKVNIRQTEESDNGFITNAYVTARDRLPKWAGDESIGNYGYAEVAITKPPKEGLHPKLREGKFFAHSSIQEPEWDTRGSGISYRPRQPKFKALRVNRYNEINGPGSWLRDVDTEYKILSHIDYLLKSNQDVEGHITLFTELAPCPSCVYVMEQFRERYPKITLDVIYNY